MLKYKGKITAGGMLLLFLAAGALRWEPEPASGAEPLETLLYQGMKLSLKRDPVTRSPLIIRREDGPLLKVKSAARLSRDQAARTGPLLVKQYRPLLPIEPDQLRLKAAVQVDGTWYVSYWQTVNGLIVYDSSLGLSIDPQGGIYSVGALLYPQVSIPPGFKITRKQAFKTGIEAVPDFKRYRYKLQVESVVVYPERTPNRLQFHKVYAFNFFPEESLHPASAIGGWAVMVDTQSGKVVYRQALFKPLGCCVPEDWVPPKPGELYKDLFGTEDSVK